MLHNPWVVESTDAQPIDRYWGLRASLVAQVVKNLPSLKVTQVQSLGQKDPLEEGMATHCSILAWRTPWTGKHDGIQSMGSQRNGHDWWRIYTYTGLYCAILCQDSRLLRVWHPLGSWNQSSMDTAGQLRMPGDCQMIHGLLDNIRTGLGCTQGWIHMNTWKAFWCDD